MFVAKVRDNLLQKLKTTAKAARKVSRLTDTALVIKYE